MNLEPERIVQKLYAQQQFQQWKKKHPQAFLSHFFCWLNKEGKEKVPWELGFFDPQDQKITSFVYQSLQEPLENQNQESSAEHQAEIFIQKKAEEVFQKAGEGVEELPLPTVRLSFSQAQEIYQKEFPRFFAQESCGEGVVLLQAKEKIAYWNFSLMGQSLAFLQMRIHAQTGEVVEHQRIEVIQKVEGNAKRSG